ncbi:metal-dependent hydrolase [Paenibacillaceae bacterium]|nr:metal-dependent hydrolase [Paenibacillaceae bacterium]
MKGTTHLAIGAAIGAAAAIYYPFTVKNAVLYITIASLSALSADLDGPSLLSSKLGKAARWIRELMMLAAVLLIVCGAYYYFKDGRIDMKMLVTAAPLFLLSLILRQGMIRNALVSLVGCGLIYMGWDYGMNGVIGFGAFVVVVPWFKHRGMSHTVWALILWAYIGRSLETDLQVQGIAIVALLGYLSHLLADTTTPSGVKWLYPFYKKSIKL